MTDHELIDDTDQLVSAERATLAKILENFREIERRRLYSDLKYGSLFEMATDRYHYSEDQAYARISAMRLLGELPQLKEKIEIGSLNITHLQIAKRLFNKKAMSGDEKLELLNKISGRSTREAERLTLAMIDEPADLKPDSTKPITENLTELRFVIDDETLAQLREFKGLMAHLQPHATLNDVLKASLKLAIAQKRAEAPRKRRVIFERAGYRCENCGSNYALEVDHIIPLAKGGPDTPENSRCLCRKCNQRAAIHEFGQRKMDMHMN